MAIFVSPREQINSTAYKEYNIINSNSINEFSINSQHYSISDTIFGYTPRCVFVQFQLTLSSENESEYSFNVIP